MYLLGQVAVMMYIVFSCPFAITMLSPLFDLEFLFNRIPLQMAHPPYPSPSTPSSPSTEIDPSEDKSLSSSSRGDQEVLELALECFAAMESGFYTP